MQSLTEMASAYNALAETDEGRAVQLRPVTKFRDAETAQRRLDAAHSSIRAWRQGQTAEDQRGPTNEGDSPTMSFAEAMAPKRSTNRRETLIAALNAAEGTAVSTTDLIVQVFGEDTPTNRKSFAVLLSNVKADMAARGLPYEIRSDYTIGLYRVGD